MSVPAQPRSHLYAPANRLDRVEKAWASAADAVIVDLEDAVPAPLKESARRDLRRWLDDTGGRGRGEVWVRINSGALGTADVDALLGVANVDGIVLAKATMDSVRELSALLASERVGWQLSPLIETADSLLSARQIATSPAVRRLQIGEYDLCADAGVTPGQDESEVAWSRSMVVFASAAAGLEAPVAPVSTTITDLASFRVGTLRAKRQGFFGRACIHPAQIPVVHEVFTPSPQEIEEARAVLDLLDSSLAEGSAVVVDSGGRMVDEAVVRQARRVLALTAAP